MVKEVYIDHNHDRYLSKSTFLISTTIVKVSIFSLEIHVQHINWTNQAGSKEIQEHRESL